MQQTISLCYTITCATRNILHHKSLSHCIVKTDTSNISHTWTQESLHIAVCLHNIATQASLHIGVCTTHQFTMQPIQPPTSITCTRQIIFHTTAHILSELGTACTLFAQHTMCCTQYPPTQNVCVPPHHYLHNMDNSSHNSRTLSDVWNSRTSLLAHQWNYCRAHPAWNVLNCISRRVFHRSGCQD